MRCALIMSQFLRQLADDVFQDFDNDFAKRNDRFHCVPLFICDEYWCSPLQIVDSLFLYSLADGIEQWNRDTVPSTDFTDLVAGRDVFQDACFLSRQAIEEVIRDHEVERSRFTLEE